MRAEKDGPTAPLEPSREVAAAWLQTLSRFCLDHIDGLEHAPAGGLPPEQTRAVAQTVSRPLGEGPLPGGMEAIAHLLGQAAQAALLAPGPGYLAYIPGGGLFASALADLVANVLNRYTGMPSPAPALFRLERDVLDWLCRQFGYGENARAVFTPGGSLATLAALVAARHAAFGDSGDFRRAVLYTSVEAHHSVGKAARLAGVPPDNVRFLPVDSGFRLDPAALAAALLTDRARGLAPFAVVAAAGTTNTGAIDPLPALVEFCAREKLWLHVDAAYGGAFVLTALGRERLRGIAGADSITFDPHKGLFLPYGTGCLLAKDGETLRRAHHLEAPYLQDLSAPSELDSWSPAELGPELSRDFRGLRLWLPLQLHGAGAFRRALEEKLALAERLCAGLEALAADGAPLEIVARPQLSLVAFRLRRTTGEALGAWNERNRRLLSAINARARVHLSSTQLPGPDGAIYTLRACVLSFRTHERHIQRCLEDIDAVLTRK